MGLVLRPAEVKSGVERVRSSIESTREGYSGALQVVQNFSQNTALQSESWDTAKNSIVEAHQAIVQGTIAAQGLVEQDLSILESSIGVEDLDEDILVLQIQRLTQECMKYEEMIRRLLIMQNSPIVGIYAAITRMISHYRLLLQTTKIILEIAKRKLLKLQETANMTSTLLQSVVPLLEAVQSAINDAEVYISGEGTIDGNWKFKIPQIIEEIETNIISQNEKVDTCVDEQGEFVGYLSYGADGITDMKADGFFMLYDGPTLESKNETVDIASLYQQYGLTPCGALQSFGGNVGPNKEGDIKYGNQDFDPVKGTLTYNGIERYAIAIGPKLQTPNIDCEAGFLANDMAYGTCVDISIQLNNQTYYIPAIIVDVKGHSAPTGIFQTGNAFNGGKNEYTGVTGPIVEWYTYQHQDGKNKSEGLNDFSQNAQLIFYRDEVLE